MRIIAYNPGHDGTSVLLENGKLIHSIESEKDSGPRQGSLSCAVFLRSLMLDDPPDALAISGFFRSPTWEGLEGNGSAMSDVFESAEPYEAGYWDEGVAGTSAREAVVCGRRTHVFSSSHVRSHLMCSYGLSPFPQGQACYALIWEGHIGSLYYIDERVSIQKVGEVLRYPGIRYSFLYELAKPVHTWTNPPGKIMALAAYGTRRARTAAEQELIDALMSSDLTDLLAQFSPAQSKFEKSPFYRIGVESQEFKDLAWQFSSALFDRFYSFAKQHVKPGLPLLVAGGCGLNCDWNSQWQHCGLFSDVFVPPCCNDSGVALGAAIDAQRHYTGKAKVQWTVYAGEPFDEDVSSAHDFVCHPLNLKTVCDHLLGGAVIAWVQGRYEMGPRALGNRSLLAAPFSCSTRDRLNDIKQREAFRPVAPICLEEEFGQHFEPHAPSPYMLYFQRVKNRQLAAITHVDGSARAQSVNDTENPRICALLREFRSQSGAGVLCNTSLNFRGCGFINRLSDLFTFARNRQLDGVVIGDHFWQPRMAT